MEDIGNDFDEDTTDGMWNEQQLQERRDYESMKYVQDGLMREWLEFSREMQKGDERIRKLIQTEKHT